jgi:hypothetical protein
MVGSLLRLLDALREFAGAQAWEQFHTSCNLASA